MLRDASLQVSYTKANYYTRYPNWMKFFVTTLWIYNIALVGRLKSPLFPRPDEVFCMRNEILHPNKSSQANASKKGIRREAPNSLFLIESL